MRSKRFVGAALVAAALTAAVVVAPAAGAQPGTGKGLTPAQYTCDGETVDVKETGGNVAFDLNGTVFHAVSITFDGQTRTFGQKNGLGTRITCTGVGFPVTVVAAPSPA